MEYRSIANMASAIRASLHRIPPSDMVLAIPRSGLIPASLIALYRNIQLNTVENFIAGQSLGGGYRCPTPDQVRSVLVVDDSVNNGRQLKATREIFDSFAKENSIKVTYVCVFYTPNKSHNADVLLQACPYPRLFEWNIFHHIFLKTACFDIDGVLCSDPSKEQNDDGPKYKEFLQNVAPLNIPSVPIGTLVTSRLEKYRPETEQWLRKQGIMYDKLIMLRNVTAQERRERALHAPHKAEIYLSQKSSNLFLESNPNQALQIFEATQKPVYCVETNELHSQSSLKQSVRDLRIAKPHYFRLPPIRRKLHAILSRILP